MVRARVRRDTPEADIEDLIQKANLEAIASKSHPRTLATARGWLGVLTARTVVRHYRESKGKSWLELDGEIDERGESGTVPDREWLISAWLSKAVAGNEREQETFELVVYKANTGKSYQEVANDHAMTEGALKSRVFALATKYEPRWRRRQSMIILLLLFGAAGLVLLVVWLLRPPPHENIQPAHDFVIPAAKPTVVPTDDPFNRALPHEEPAKPPVPNKPTQDKPPM